jgi:hypothetical protein
MNEVLAAVGNRRCFMAQEWNLLASSGRGGQGFIWEFAFFIQAKALAHMQKSIP